MTKQDILDILRAISDFNELDEAVQTIASPSGISEAYQGLYGLGDVIKRYSKKYSGDNDKLNDEFYNILNDPELSIEEKYRLLFE